MTLGERKKEKGLHYSMSSAHTDAHKHTHDVLLVATKHFHAQGGTLGVGAGGGAGGGCEGKRRELDIGLLWQPCPPDVTGDGKLLSRPAPPFHGRAD